MIRISKSTLSWGGVAIAAILFTLAVPRAAHAVAAALVQVTNTASSPVISQSIGNQAAQIVEIECGYLPGSGIGGAPTVLLGCIAMPATGLLQAPVTTSNYTVPAGETLVVTSVDIFSGAAVGTPCMSPAFPQLSVVVPTGPGTYDLVYRKAWIVPGGTGTAHYAYPSGILFSPGAIIQDVSNFVGNCSMTVDLHGYLTAQ
jgi:hypothetical protein